MKNRQQKLREVCIPALVFLVFFVTMMNVKDFSFIASSLVRAEDEKDEEKDEKNYHEEDGEEDSNVGTSSSSKTSTVTETKVDTHTIAKTTTVVRKDSDGDELFDDEDPHPDINENFIVRDDNRNGIVDVYEE